MNIYITKENLIKIMEERPLIIAGSVLALFANILVIIIAIKAFQTNLFLAILSIIFCIAIAYFDGVLAKYFIHKIKERNERKN